MKQLYLILGIAVLLGTALFLFQHKKSTSFQSEVSKQYEIWKQTYNKQYNAETDKLRYQIFYENYKLIKNHQSKSYELGVNQFMDLTKSEFIAQYLGYKQNTPNQEQQQQKEEVPQVNGGSVDWRTEGAVTEVKDQGQCGSCWAFSSTGSLESLYFLKKNPLTEFSEQQLVDCSTSYGNQGCNGGLMDNAFQYVEDSGITTEEAYPYKGVDQDCQSFSSVFKITKYSDVKKGLDNTYLKVAVKKQPVSVAVDAENWQFYSGGIFDDCKTSLDHGVLIVGYTDDFWIVKNSWAATWGEDGYIRLKMGNTCGIRNAASYPDA